MGEKSELVNEFAKRRREWLKHRTIEPISVREPTYHVSPGLLQEVQSLEARLAELNRELTKVHTENLYFLANV